MEKNDWKQSGKIRKNGKKSRKKTPNSWFELQDTCAYHAEFEKEKIIYPNMTKYIPFILDKEHYYTNQKCFILTGKHLPLIVSVLNSSLAYFWIKKISSRVTRRHTGTEQSLHKKFPDASDFFGTGKRETLEENEFDLGII